MEKSSIEQAVRTLADPATRPDDSPLYALIDGALHRPALKEVTAFARPHFLIPAGGVVARADLSALPFLVELTAGDGRPNTRLIRRLSAWAIEHASVTWIASSWPAPLLADQLALRMEAELPQNMAVVLRFADARVLPVLHEALDVEQRTRFFSCVTGWWYFSRQGDLRALSFHREPGAAPLTFEPPLKLTATQEQQLIDAAEPDAVMQILRRHDAEALEQLAPGERHDFVESAIGRARAWSVEAPSDLALFCMVALAQGLTFDALPHWQEALTRLREGHTTMIDVIQQQAAQA